ncbi:hypothetical protein [Streptomyces sp. NBC_01537]|uniref:arsenate reductase/protein-tyrosine-phosphatase family protein n=1 Tax=Streptomyces sp. NBC_01537 TaxID=2903896 RepID=UPI003866B1F9
MLFLCVHNACRSQMAMGFFQHLAGDNAFAWSGGSEPGFEVNPVATRSSSWISLGPGQSRPRPAPPQTNMNFTCKTSGWRAPAVEIPPHRCELPAGVRRLNRCELQAHAQHPEPGLRLPPLWSRRMRGRCLSPARKRAS